MYKFTHYFEMAIRAHWLKMLPKFVNYTKYKLKKLTPVVKSYTPSLVNLNLINRCNLRCSYCGLANDGVFDEEKKEMTIDTVKTIFSHPLLKKALLVDLLGGEPLLCKDIIKITAFLSSSGYLTNIITNGLLLPDKISDLKKAGITSINVSIYPKNTNMLRKTLKDINKIFPVQVSYLLTKSLVENNQQEIMEIVEMSKNSGCKFITFNVFIPSGKFADFSEVMTDDLPAYHSLLVQIKNKFNDFVLWRPLSHASENGKGSEKKCRELWRRISINAKGEITPCCGKNSSYLPNVNIFTSTADEIFNHPDVIEYRKNLLDKSIPALPICQTCHLLNDAGW
jgi:MoaA/NifB/PqqE/SkfB family radical SAM enzyme